MPILGIYASSMQPALNASSYESIATVTVGAGGSSSISFTSIPSTYKHLQIRAIANAGNIATGTMQLNSDTATNYSTHYLYGDGSSAVSGAQVNAAYMYCALNVSNANIYAASVIDILDYGNTNKYKTIRSLSGGDINGAGGYIELLSGNWRNTNAITQITLLPTSGNYTQYSSFALYGVK